MSNTDNNAMRFLRWWVNGLNKPWLFSHRPRQIIRATSSGWALITEADAAPQALDSSELAVVLQRNKHSSYYLLADSEKVINTAIPDTKKSSSLASITEQLLPFASQELYIAANTQFSKIFAIARSEVQQQMSSLESLGVLLRGVAFAENTEFHFAEIDCDIANDTRRSIKFVAQLVGLLVIAATILTASIWQWERSQQQKLSSKVQALLSSEQANLPEELSAQLLGLNIRGARQIDNELRALVEQLPLTAEIGQVILTEHEVLIDAKAPSAIAVQAAVDASSLFTGSEFVTAISADANNQIERFRLKISRRQAPLNEQKPQD